MVYGRRPDQTYAAYHYTRERELAAARQAARQRMDAEYAQEMKRWEQQDLESGVIFQEPAVKFINHGPSVKSIRREQSVPVEQQPDLVGHIYSNLKRKIAQVGACALSIFSLGTIVYTIHYLSTENSAWDDYGVHLLIISFCSTFCAIGAWKYLYETG